MKFLAFDIETTGLPHDQERVAIIQFAGMILDSDLEPTRDLVVNEFIQFPIPENQLLHGKIRFSSVALDMQKKLGRELNFFADWNLNNKVSSVTFYKMLYEWLNRHRNGEKLVPFGHNVAQFDYPILLKEAYNHGYDLSTVLDYHCFDTSCLSFPLLMDGTIKKNNLTSLADFFEIERKGEAHDALSDLLLTIEVAKKLLNK